jgi:hypothetical protein
MTKSKSFFTRLGYGQFPYIIIREQAGMYRQVPIHFGLENLETKEGVIIRVNDCDSHEILETKCDEALIHILTKQPILLNHRINYDQGCFVPDRKLSGCVVFSPENVIYRSRKGELINKSASIPWGGTLLSLCDERIEFEHGNHFTYNL